MAQFAVKHISADGLSASEQQAAVKRARLRRPMYVAQLLSFVLDAGILAAYYLAGTTDASIGWFYLVAGAGWTGITLALSEAHFNDRFSDHYLTVPQSLGTITIQLIAIYLAPEIGIYFVSVMFIILGFGALRMSASQARVVWTYAAVGLTILFGWTDRPVAIPMGTPIERDLALLCFVTALGRCAFTGLYGTSLREALYKRGNELKAAHARIEELAQIDELTGLLNRRYIMKALDEEIARVQRTREPCSIAIIDLDFFKRINDGFGHPTGDEVLRGFAGTVAASMRAVDKLGRYGGEEFLLILPGAAQDQAVAVVDRLRQSVADIDWNSISGDLRVTISAGVADIRAHEAPENILTRADLALYRAKDAGRNRVMAA